MRRLLVLAGVAVLALLGIAAPASAHNVLISSDPAEGEQIAAAPEAVTLTFDQEVQDAGTNEVAVTGPDGGQWAEGLVQVNGNEVTAPLRPLGPAGEYVIGFRILSADGHSVSEELRFTLTTAGTGTPAGDPAASAAPGTEQSAAAGQDTGERAEADSSGVPVWVWIVAAVVLLGIGIVVAMRMGNTQDKRS
ncbi:copper resistance CopC family protein [Qaidamihabitans albus]|uniref:copper resistance CopC family protein n=1 Tax=Qaidamihabitans albus TaxID=2795733 RepID=UPI0018F2481F|nr:copper resistance CopC family protein [Qaidamihabitans albus]